MKLIYVGGSPKTLLPSPRRGSSRDGQAIVEFMVGLVAVLAIFGGLLQVASLTKAHTDVMTKARRLAAEQAMINNDAPTGPNYIHEWKVGQDEKTYTLDDAWTPADPGALDATITDRAAENDDGWDVINSAPQNNISQLHNNLAAPTLFGLVNGSDAKSVELLPAVQDLIYDAPSIVVRGDVWMTRIHGLY